MATQPSRAQAAPIVPLVFHFGALPIRVIVDYNGDPCLCQPDVEAALGRTLSVPWRVAHLRIVGENAPLPFLDENDLYNLTLEDTPNTDFEVWLNWELAPVFVGEHRPPPHLVRPPLQAHPLHLDALRAFLADRYETDDVELVHALGLTGDAQGNLTRVGLLMAQCPDWEKVRPQRRGRRAYVWRRNGAALPPPASPVQPKAEPAALPLAPLPPDLHAFIFQHAHRLSAAAFDPLREWMERNARAHLAQGYSPEFVREWMEKHVGHPCGEVLLMRARDVVGMASTLAAVRALVDVELGEVARLEAEFGRQLYGRVAA